MIIRVIILCWSTTISAIIGQQDRYVKYAMFDVFQREHIFAPNVLIKDPFLMIGRIATAFLNLLSN